MKILVYISFTCISLTVLRGEVDEIRNSINSALKTGSEMVALAEGTILKQDFLLLNETVRRSLTNNGSNSVEILALRDKIYPCYWNFVLIVEFSLGRLNRTMLLEEFKPCRVFVPVFAAEFFETFKREKVDDFCFALSVWVSSILDGDLVGSDIGALLSLFSGLESAIAEKEGLPNGYGQIFVGLAERLQNEGIYDSSLEDFYGKELSSGLSEGQRRELLENVESQLRSSTQSIFLMLLSELDESSVHLFDDLKLTILESPTSSDNWLRVHLMAINQLVSAIESSS